MGELYNPFPRLPKNIRQVGERDQTVRLYVEDYVNTYLNRLYPKGGQDLRVGVLLGTAEERDGTPFLFVDGAMEIEDVTEQGEKVCFTETAWKKTYQAMEQMFPKRVIMGWFLCGGHGCALSPLNYWKEHGKYFAGKNQLMYLSGGLDGEEAIYAASEDGFYKLRGYSIYYERNQMMQDYMILRKDVRRVESGAGDTVIRDFRQRMEDTKNQADARRGTIRVLSGLCTGLAILVLAGGVAMVDNYEKMKEMRAVLASVLPDGVLQETDAGAQGASSSGGAAAEADGQAGGVTVENIEGNVHLSAEREQFGGLQLSAGTVNEDQNGNGSETAPEGETSGLYTAEGGAVEAAAGETVPGTFGEEEESGPVSGAETGGETAGSGNAVSVVTVNGSSNETAAEESRTSDQSSAREVMAGESLYLVQPGDTLYGICLERYGDGSLMEEICRINNLESEDKITSGQNLILP